MQHIHNGRRVTETALSLGKCLKNVLVIVIVKPLKKKGIQKKQKKHPLELESHLESEKCNRKFEVILCKIGFLKFLNYWIKKRSIC